MQTTAFRCYTTILKFSAIGKGTNCEQFTIGRHNGDRGRCNIKSCNEESEKGNKYLNMVTGKRRICDHHIKFREIVCSEDRVKIFTFIVHIGEAKSS